MNRIEFGDCRETMRRWAQEGVKVQTCVTSPPYFGLRDYGTASWHGGDSACDHIESENKHGGQRADRNQEGYKKQYKNSCKKCGASRVDNQIGLEQTPEDYIAAMVEVFRCVWDVLADNGTLWLNIGDSYVHSQPGRNRNGTGGQIIRGDLYRQKNNDGASEVGRKLLESGLKTKDLIGIPWMLAFALRADGWYLRQDIIWHKPNPMPESVRDRCTKAHEYIFLLSKSERYFFDSEAIKEPAVSGPAGNVSHKHVDAYFAGDDTLRTKAGLVKFAEKQRSGEYDGKRNRRSVWTVATRPYKGAHFATFPPDLIEPCILAGSREGDIVLDPFMGSGTTAQVALQNGRQYLGCELNEDYKALQDDRIAKALPEPSPQIDMFAEA